jgi:ABC-type tungstate transport system permease subunit
MGRRFGDDATALHDGIESMVWVSDDDECGADRREQVVWMAGDGSRQSHGIYAEAEAAVALRVLWGGE